MLAGTNQSHRPGKPHAHIRPARAQFREDGPKLPSSSRLSPHTSIHAPVDSSNGCVVTAHRFERPRALRSPSHGLPSPALQPIPARDLRADLNSTTPSCCRSGSGVSACLLRTEPRRRFVWNNVTPHGFTGSAIRRIRVGRHHNHPQDHSPAFPEGDENSGRLVAALGERHVTEVSLMVSKRAGLRARAEITTGGLLSVAALVSTILLSTAVLVHVASNAAGSRRR